MTPLDPVLTVHKNFTFEGPSAQLERVAADSIVRGEDANIDLYEGPITLKEGRFRSAITETMTVVKDDNPKKFVKVSVIVYDALVRFWGKMVIG